MKKGTFKAFKHTIYFYCLQSLKHTIERIIFSFFFGQKAKVENQVYTFLQIKKSLNLSTELYTSGKNIVCLEALQAHFLHKINRNSDFVTLFETKE